MGVQAKGTADGFKFRPFVGSSPTETTQICETGQDGLVALRSLIRTVRCVRFAFDPLGRKRLYSGVVQWLVPQALNLMTGVRFPPPVLKPL